MGLAVYEVLTTQMINDIEKRKHLNDVYVEERIILKKLMIYQITSWRHIGGPKV